MRHLESSLQKEVVKYLRLELRYFGGIIYAVPNGDKRDKIIGARLKQEGVLAGVADLHILLPGGRIIFVEMKTKSGKQSENQKLFQEMVENLGFEYIIWRSIDDAILWVKNNLRKLQK